MRQGIIGLHNNFSMLIDVARTKLRYTDITLRPLSKLYLGESEGRQPAVFFATDGFVFSLW